MTMPFEDRPPTARDRIAFVIAVGLVSWGLLTIISLTYSGKTLGESGGEVLLPVAVGLVAALTAYFTTK